MSLTENLIRSLTNNRLAELIEICKDECKKREICVHNFPDDEYCEKCQKEWAKLDERYC